VLLLLPQGDSGGPGSDHELVPGDSFVFLTKGTTLVATVIVLLTGCGGVEKAARNTDDRSVPATRMVSSERLSSSTRAADAGSSSRLKSFAYRQMKQLSRKTCRVVPREVLSRSFGRASDDPLLGGSSDPAEWTDNYVALAFAEDVKIHPIRLQQAAYDGCMAGLDAAAK